MLSLHTIITIARYETKNLFRSWFFRIFCVLALVILGLINTAMFAHQSSPSMFSALPSFLPYLNVLLLNVVQAVIGVFLACDFMKYDNKLDTTDVIYMREMTNADYVLGKTLGVFVVFGVLNAIVLIMAFVFNVFLTDIPFVFAVYGLYPLLISLPTLMFIFGLSFITMAIIRSQAITFIVLLGYIAITMFFLGNRFHYLFDYMTFNVPLAYSDFVGFGDITIILIHRGIYFLFGLGFIFMTVLLLKRLPQSRIMNTVSLVVAVCSITGAIVLSGMYLSELSSGKSLRKNMVALNKQEADKPKITLKTCNLDLTHAGDTIDVQAHLTFTNNSSTSIDRYLFSLNPGLEIDKVEQNGGNIPFTRNLHILTVEPAMTLKPGATDSLMIFYSGTIDDEACYTDIDETKREENFKVMLFNIGKRYSFITPRYVLLTPENLWYPVAGIPYGSAYPRLQSKDFVTFTLRVRTNQALTAVSQGAVTRGDKGEFIFTPEVPLTQFSLAIGGYENRSVTVDDTDYSLYILKGHDYFSQYFTELKEKLPELIRDTRSNFENRIGITYPYKRLLLIEVPTQFVAYPRLWTLSEETVQPEQVLMREKGLLISNADFKQRSYWMERRGQRGSQVSTPEEMQSRLFQSFATSTLTNVSSPFRFFQRAIRSRMGQGFSLRRLAFGIGPNFSYSGSYSIFPHFYAHCHHFSSEKWPIFTTAMEFFISERIENRPPSFIRSFLGLSVEERANLELMKRDLIEILDDPENTEDIHDILKLKSNYLFALIQSAVGTEAFKEFLDNMLASHRFSTIEVEDFVIELRKQFGFDLEPLFESWFHEKQLPAFIASEPECYEILENEQTRYQVTFTISNPEPVDGLISIDFRTREGGVRRGGGGMAFMFGSDSDSESQRFISLRGGETKEIGIVLDDAPRAMTINTFISQNIPSVFDKGFGRIERDEDAIPFDGERILTDPINLKVSGEIIVDNEDTGFETQSDPSDSYVKRLITTNNEEEDDYIGIQFWNIPRRWRATPNSEFYGTYIHSAQYIRAGKGDNRVTWNTDIPRSGQYDVYYYVSNIRAPRRRGRGGDSQESIRDFHFTIHHDDGVDEVELDMGGADEGWNKLGTYYFSQGKASIELSDRSKGRLVYADAIKWKINE